MRRTILLVEIDGVCRNFAPVMARLYEQEFGEKPARPLKTWKMKDMFPRLKDPNDFFFFSHARRLLEESPMMANCSECLQRIAASFDVRLFSNQQGNYRDCTLAWLNNHGLDQYPVAFAADLDFRARNAGADILLDININNLRAFSRFGGLPIAFNHPSNSGWEGERVYSWLNFEIFMRYHPAVQKVGRESRKEPLRVHHKFFQQFMEL